MRRFHSFHRTAALTTLVLNISGCGGDGQTSTPSDVSAFLGAWEYQSGTETTACLGVTDSADLAGRNLDYYLTRGTDSDLFAVKEVRPHPGSLMSGWKVNVSGNVATAKAGQQISGFSNELRVNVTDVLQELTFTLQGSTAKEKHVERATFGEGETSFVCTRTWSGTLFRPAADTPAQGATADAGRD